MALIGYIITVCLGVTLVIACFLGYFIWRALSLGFTAAGRGIITLCIRERKLISLTSRSRRAERRLGKLLSRYDALKAKNHNPRTAKKIWKLRKKLHKEINNFNLLEGIMKKELMKHNETPDKREEFKNKEKPLNLTKPPHLEGASLIKPSRFAFVNRRKAEVYRSVAETFKAGQEIVDSMVELERSYHRLKDIDTVLEVDQLGRNLQKEEIFLEKECVEASREALRQRED